MRLDPRFRAALYVDGGALVVTGAGWLVVERLKPVALANAWQTSAAYLLMVHGGAAMVMLLLLGALAPLHVSVGWRRRSNRISGLCMLAASSLLIVTAFGLYYSGAEVLRYQASVVHTGIGLGLPVLWAVHVWLGKRRVRPPR